MNRSFLLFFAVTVVLFAGCSHTNELAKYNLDNKGMIFNEYTSANARRIQITTVETYNKKEDNSVLGAIASLGSDILNSDSKNKIIKAVNTAKLVNYVSKGLKDALVTYMNVQPVENVNDNPQFITHVTLESCSLLVGEKGVSVRVHAEAKIVDRTTGAVVWDNWETQTIPIEKNSGVKNDSKAMEQVMTALQLASLDEEEINNVVDLAAEDVGFFMAETLRKDVAEAYKQ